MKVDDNRGVRGIIDASTTPFRPQDYRQKRKKENLNARADAAWRGERKGRREE